MSWWFAGQPWAPSAFTPPLSDRPVSDGPRLIELLDRHWRLPTGELVTLDDWQRALYCALLERFPADWPDQSVAGQLRYRQAVVSMGRQNGKSLIGGGLALYGLTQHTTAPSVVGVATSVDQANVVYQRVRYTVRKDPMLDQLMTASGTRGIKWRDGRGGYQVKPALAEGIQSVPVTLGVADELHLMSASMWQSLVNGQRAQRDALLAGITTAGDDTSLLLLDLYSRGWAAVNNPASDLRFGFFLWEAPAGATIDTPGAVESANPAVASGRVPLSTVLSDIRKLPRPDQERYCLNLFVAASRSWADLDQWASRRSVHPIDLVEYSVPITFGVGRTAGWEWVTITAAIKRDDTILTQVVASLRQVTRDQLADILRSLTGSQPGSVVALDARQLGDLAKLLRASDVEVWPLSLTEQTQAAAGVWARVVDGTLTHAGDQILTHQLPTTRQIRNRDGSWYLAPGSAAADAVLATWAGAHVADIRPAARFQLYTG